jgi:hypothetical protein
VLPDDLNRGLKPLVVILLDEGFEDDVEVLALMESLQVMNEGSVGVIAMQNDGGVLLRGVWVRANE